MFRLGFLILPIAAATPLCAAVVPPLAQRTFVSANGNDANLCTRTFPCRSFAAAVALTNSDGEVIVLDSGGYGPVTITQAVSLISPEGVYAGITAVSAGKGITVNASDSAQVILRNLNLNSQGGDVGIYANKSVAVLYVENCAINAFESGIGFVPTTSGARLYVSDSVIRGSSYGIYVAGGTGIRATIDSTRLQQNNIGFYITHAEAAIHDCEATGGLNWGFRMDTGSLATIEHTVSAGNGTGYYAYFATAILTRCAATSSTTVGINADFGGTIYVSNCTISANGVGVSEVLSGAPPGIVSSGGNNTLQDNATNGSFTNTFAAQ